MRGVKLIWADSNSEGERELANASGDVSGNVSGNIFGQGLANISASGWAEACVKLLGKLLQTAVEYGSSGVSNKPLEFEFACLASGYEVSLEWEFTPSEGSYGNFGWGEIIFSRSASPQKPNGRVELVAPG